MQKKIKQKFKKLKKELYIIQCKNWVENKGEGLGEAGLTLEYYLGKQPDQVALPDYEGIEIKTRNRYSDYDLHLFCAALDGKPLEMQRLLRLGGYPSSTNKEYKNFNTTVSAVNLKEIRAYSYHLKVDYEAKKLKLIIGVRNRDKVVEIMSWSFDMLKERLETKMKYLALVNYIRDRKYGRKFFKYLDPEFYELRGFKEFLKLVESGEIRVTFKLNEYQSGEREHEVHDRGTSFDININSLAKLYKELTIKL